MSGFEDGYDCIIIGAGPGGLQAAIYLGRYNRKVLLIDRGGGRTAHARKIENFLTHESISGTEIVERGRKQALGFHVRIVQGTATQVRKEKNFSVATKDRTFEGKFVIVASGVYDHFPPIANLHEHLGQGFLTCVDCDGYRTTGKKLLVIGNTMNTVRLAFGMNKMFTRDVTLNLIHYEPPEGYREELQSEGIAVVKGTPIRIVGDVGAIEAVELKNGSRIPCQVIMSNFGFRLNDEFLSGLDLKRDAEGFKYVTNHHFESSLRGLYIVGPLNTGHDQAIIAAGGGAVAALDIKSRLLEI